MSEVVLGTVNSKGLQKMKLDIFYFTLKIEYCLKSSSYANNFFPFICHDGILKFFNEVLF